MVRLETSIVLAQKFDVTAATAERLFDAFIWEAQISVVEIDDNTGKLAVAAFGQFGKGRHPAKLNLADCFSYALAKSMNVKLLYVGNDFSKTDIASAL